MKDRCFSLYSHNLFAPFAVGRYRCWYRGNYYRYRYETDTGSIGRYPIPDTGIGLSLIHMTNRFGFPKIGPFDSTTAWSLYAIFDCDWTVDATAAGTKTGKMSVKTSICPSRPPTFHHSTVECWPDELNRFESIFWCESNRIEIIFGELECTTA